MNLFEMERHFEASVRYRIVIRGGGGYGGVLRTKYEKTAMLAARFVEQLGKLPEGQAVYVYVCRSLALAVYPK